VLRLADPYPAVSASDVPIAYRKHGLKHDNNPTEREKQRIKTLTKDIRFKSRVSCRQFLDMLETMHNFIKPSILLKSSYLAEEADIKLPLGSNRILSIIQISGWRSKMTTEEPESNSLSTYQPNSHENQTVEKSIKPSYRHSNVF
jgi:hypothetical protein